MNNVIVTFGEIMGRIDMPGKKKLIQALPGEVSYNFAGAEASVAVSLSYLGKNTRYVTSLPSHELGDACINKLRGLGVDTGFIHRGPGRMGVYYVETGANQRPSKVVYDREYSAISMVDFEAFDWDTIFKDATWLHTTGITAALSRKSAENTLKVCRLAKERGLKVSCDLNFRAKLWNFDPECDAKTLAQRTMPEILEYVDVLIGNEEDAAVVLDIHAEGTDIQSGVISSEGYVSVARQIVERFPDMQKVAITLRESISATHNNWGGMLYDKAEDKACFGPVAADGSYDPYAIYNIVDRVGGGDSFAAGLVYALNSAEYAATDRAIRFAAAASCLCHSISGDFNYSSLAEVERLLKGDRSGRVQR